MIAVATAAVLAIAGVASSIPNPFDGLARIVRGYTSGKECYQANCSTLPTLIKRMECCEASCPGSWYLDCANEAVGEDPGESLRTLTWAAKQIDYANPFSLPGDLDRAASFIVVCSRSTNPLIAKMAAGFAAESTRITAILKAAEPHNEQGGGTIRNLVMLDVPGVESVTRI